MATPPVFSAGAVLTAAQMNAIGLWEMTPTSVAGTGVSLSGSTVTVTASTTANINGCFTSDFDNYKIVVQNVTSNTTESIKLRLRTTTDAATNYSYGGVYRLFAGTGGDITANATAQFVLLTTSTSPACGATLDVLCPNLAQATHFMAMGSNFDAGVMLTGVHTTASAYTGFTLLTNSGNTFSAVIRIYGYRN